ncbi:hypothetical protein [Mesobacillus harenae]|uniref:hypothetical protein n=1 Tax=Mesobacillus harenae TaxID=2213203 RepID=UPI00158053E5|nr:hypothetical protein [Mesobacillus harenae]
MGKFPPFHPDWLITFWFKTPGLNRLDPHWMLGILAVFGTVILYSLWKRKQKSEPEADEQAFKRLLLKKNVIEEQLLNLEEQRKQGEITEVLYRKRIGEFQEHLDIVKKQLLQFTL